MRSIKWGEKKEIYSVLTPQYFCVRVTNYILSQSSFLCRKIACAPGSGGGGGRKSGGGGGEENGIDPKSLSGSAVFE